MDISKLNEEINNVEYLGNKLKSAQTVINSWPYVPDVDNKTEKKEVGFYKFDLSIGAGIGVQNGYVSSYAQIPKEVIEKNYEAILKIVSETKEYYWKWLQSYPSVEKQVDKPYCNVRKLEY